MLPTYLKYLLIFGPLAIMLFILFKASRDKLNFRGYVFWLVFSLVCLAMGSFPILPEETSRLLEIESPEKVVIIVIAVMLIVKMILISFDIAHSLSKKSESGKEKE